MKSQEYAESIKAVLPDWNIVTDEPFGMSLRVAIERKVGDCWHRRGWAVNDSTPTEVADKAMKWVKDRGL